MTEVIRLPLLVDHHTHPLLYAAFAKAVPLFDVQTQSAANQLILEACKQSESEMIVAHGWRSNYFDWNPSEIESLPPVAIFNVSLHSLRMNAGGRRVMKKLQGDDVDRVDDQNWYEENFRRVLNWFANLYASEEALVDFYEQLLQLGIYSAEELLLFDEREIELFQNAGLIDRTRFWAAPDTFASLSQSAKDQVHGLKLFTDGAIGARTAALNRPFIGEPAGDQTPNHGKLLYTDESLQQTVEECLSTAKALAIHAIGDRAIEQTVSTLENCSSKVYEAPQVRIEHAQLIDRNTAARAKELGLILSMQPNFSSDSVDYRDRLDEQYCQANNPFRMLIDEIGFEPGKDLIFGSDGMPHGIKFALQQSIFPSLQSQKLSVEEFQLGYCVQSTQQGSIEIELDSESCQVIACTRQQRSSK